jgi:Na+/melibiose symporter-like transporter
MKIYQLHKYGGEWEDAYDYIIGTYWLKKRAEEEKSKAEAKENASTLNTVLPGIIMLVVALVYNALMWLRKSERVYFARRKVSGGGNTFVYYLISTLVQAAVLICGIVVAISFVSSNSTYYIPSFVTMTKSIVFIIITACISVLVAVENMVLAQKTKK